jgi:glycosyltransferase involved in cell wall biosynthesis
MGVSNAIDGLVATIRTTAGRPDILWWLAGTGRDAAKLQALAGGPVKFFGSMPKADVIDLYCGADLNVITFLPDPLFEENSPNKFFDGIAAGLPALFNRSTWLRPWLDQYGCGIICDGLGKASLGGSILQLADNPTRRAVMSQGAKRLAQEVFSRELLAAKYLELIKKPFCGDSVP